MLHALYTKGSDVYDVKPIEDKVQIDLDMATVADVISDTDPDYYRTNMVSSIEQGLAYDIWKNGVRVGFVYNMIQDELYYGCCITIWDPVAMIIGLREMFEICDKHRISFAPHTYNLKDFISMAAGPSIRLFHTTDTPMVYMLRDEIYPKGKRIMEYLGVVRNG